jgi:hypothetical protein
MLHDMPQSSSEGVDPVQRARQIITTLSQSEHAQTYQWLRERLPMDKIMEHQANPAFSELEIIRAAAVASAEFLEAEGTTVNSAVALSRKTRKAIEHVLHHVSLSQSACEELLLAWRRLRWLDAIAPKGRLREQVLIWRIFQRMRGWTDEESTTALTPLLVALTKIDKETAAKDIRRWFVRFKRLIADLEAKRESQHGQIVR